MTRALLARLLVLAWLLLAGPALADHEPFTEGGGMRHLPWSMLHDPDGRLAFADVLAAARAGQFVPMPPGEHNLGYVSGTTWMQVTLSNPAGELRRVYLDVGPPRLQDVRFHEPLPGGGWQVYESGLRVPVADREVRHRLPLLRTELAPGETRTVFVRIESGNAVSLEANVWDPRAFSDWSNRVDQVNLFQLGAVFLFVLYATVLALTVRERLYLLFALALGTQGLYEVAILQYGFQWLWPHAPDWSLRSPGVALALASAVFAVLVSELLGLRERGAAWRRWLLGGALLQLVLVPLLLWLDYAAVVQVANLVALYLFVASILAAAWAVRVNVPGAWLLLLAFAATWAVALLRMVQILGAAPRDWLPGDYSYVIASIVSGLLLVVHMAGNVRAAAVERERLRERELRSAAEARSRLEFQVAERTRDLERARDRAEEANAAKSSFLAQMGHEFRTPLHGVLGYASLMLDEARSTDDRRRLEAIRRSGRHLLALIDELLEFTRAESGRVELEPHPVALSGFLADIVDEMQPVARGAGLALSLDAAPGLPAAVSVDQVRLRQVLLNLLANACQHSRARHAVLGVQAGRLPDGRVQVRFRVEDDGVGMGADEVGRLFELFWQAERTRGGGGLGLGLPIARQWVRRMGGDLEVDSRPGAGTRFRFALALPVVAPPATTTGQWVVQRVGAALGDGRPRVLVVDDRRENRELMAEMLGTAGVEPLVADGGAEALEVLGRESCALVLVDQMMPGMDGWALLTEARRRGLGMPC